MTIGFAIFQFAVGALVAGACIRFGPRLVARLFGGADGAKLLSLQLGGLFSSMAVFAALKCALFYIEGVRWLVPILQTTLTTLIATLLVAMFIVVLPWMKRLNPFTKNRKEAPFGASFKLWEWMLG
ncbi:MAG: hypothetical protein LBR00_03500 [Clostridiales Family XIII bacterium]|jgi:hypothetical protein|nr:hypothetical protein [Clostridiales Family XIII bacterium]